MLRRKFLAILATSPFLSKLAFPAKARTKSWDFSVQLWFENGDYQECFYKVDKVEKPTDNNKRVFYVQSHNLMGHHEVTIDTSFEFTNDFSLGKITQIENPQPFIWYTGRNSEGEIIYQGRVTKKIWKENANIPSIS